MTIPTTSVSKSRTWLTALCLLGVLVVGYFTHFRNYQYPPALFWDENYHIASAQKYLHNTFFMEPHPPLGKLLLALGEKLIHPNPESNQFLDTMYINNNTLPKGFSFAGYRFFPALLSWLTIVPLFLIFMEITRSRVISLALSSLYLFDNAIIVHNRGAMLEAPQLLFFVLMILAFLKLADPAYRSARSHLIQAVLFGTCFGLALATKINSLIALILWAALIWKLWPSKRLLVRTFIPALLSFSVAYIGVWQIHFSLASEIHPALKNEGYFLASDSYKELLKNGGNNSLLNFPLMLKDSMHYFADYQHGVPTLNLCKNDENGSPALFWPIGARAIDYRWERESPTVYRYLFLQINPFSWGVILVALVIGASLLTVRLLFSQSDSEVMAPGAAPLLTEWNAYLLFTFLAVYLGYLGALSQATRVMYLYHFFLPQLFAMVIVAIVIAELKRCGPLKINERHRTSVACGIAVCSFFSFLAYSPLTYYLPISNEQLSRLAILGTWDLHCPTCPRTNIIANPPPVDGATSKQTPIYLSGVKAFDTEQEWGVPATGKTVDGTPFVVAGKSYPNGLGVHAYSSLKFRLDKDYARFEATVGMPDYLKGKGGSVVFKVLGDKKELWSSPIMRPGGKPLPVQIALKDLELLELQVLDAGDGNTSDHACWLDAKLLER